jgi:hypothetical protein
MGIIAFFNGLDATQKDPKVIEDAPGQDISLTEDNTILSAKLYNVRPGCEIRVYDSLDGSFVDDACIIRVKRFAPEYTIKTFERSYEDEYVIVAFIRNNGLGKVSRIKVN